MYIITYTYTYTYTYYYINILAATLLETFMVICGVRTAEDGESTPLPLYI